MANTLTYSDKVKGWASFYTFYPDYMIGMNNMFYTFSGGNMYRHHTNQSINNYYGNFEPSEIETTFNDVPLDDKLFKTINIEGTKSWEVNISTELGHTAKIEKDWFDKKESSWFSHIRKESTDTSNVDYNLRSAKGIGLSRDVDDSGEYPTVYFEKGTDLTGVASYGDYIFYAIPDNYETVTLYGEVEEVSNGGRDSYPYIVVKDIVANPDDPDDGDNPVDTAKTSSGGGGDLEAHVPVNWYFMCVKNSMAESSGVNGVSMDVRRVYDSEDAMELFAIESDVMKSYP